MTGPAAVTDRAGLRQALRTLKLSGMLQTLDARLIQANAGNLGHLEFLQVLCEDEINRRETVSLAKRIRRARFQEQATLEGFDFAAAPKLPAAQIRGLAALRWLHAGDSVILYGPVGAGKTASVRTVLAGLDASRHTIIYLPNPMIGVRGLHEMIVATFGGQPDRSGSRLTAQASAILAAERDERGRTPAMRERGRQGIPGDRRHNRGPGIRSVI